MLAVGRDIGYLEEVRAFSRRRHNPDVVRDGSGGCASAINEHLVMVNRQTRLVRPEDLDLWLIHPVTHDEGHINQWRVHGRQRGHVSGVALRIQIKTVRPAHVAAPRNQEPSRAIRRHARMDLSVDDRGVDPQFTAPSRAVRMQELPIHSLLGTILAHAGPDDEVIRPDSADFGAVLISESKGVHQPGRSPRARAGEWPGKNIPAIRPDRGVHLSPRHHEAAVRRRRHLRIGANISAGVDEKLITDGGAARRVKPAVDINAWAARIVREALLLGDPDDNESAAAQGGHRRRALIE